MCVSDHVIAIVPHSCHNEFHVPCFTSILKSAAVHEECRLDPSFAQGIPFDFNKLEHQSACFIFVVPASNEKLFSDQQSNDATLDANLPFSDFALNGWPMISPCAHVYRC